jgi:hypothetical protein
MTFLEFINGMPDRIADFLDREKGLGRHFREESVTDLLMFELSAFQGHNLQVHFSKKEPENGADMIWHFVRQGKNASCFSLYIQAKRAHPTGAKGQWAYDKLDYKSSNGDYQAETLWKQNKQNCGTVYLLYNPGRTCKVDNSGKTQGLNFMSAEPVKDLVLKGCSSKDKLVNNWRSHFLLFSELLCAAMRERPFFTAEADVRLTSLQFIGGVSESLTVDPSGLATLLNQKARAAGYVSYYSSSPVPKHVEDLISGRTIDVEQNTVIFLDHSPKSVFDLSRRGEEAVLTLLEELYEQGVRQRDSFRSSRRRD